MVVASCVNVMAMHSSLGLSGTIVSFSHPENWN